MYIVSSESAIDKPAYARLKSTCYAWVLNPRFATPFGNMDAATRWVETHTALNIDAVSIVDVKDACDGFDSQASAGLVLYQTPLLDRTISRMYNDEDAESILEWWFAYTKHEPHIRSEHYASWPELYSVFKCIWDINKYIPDEIVPVIRVRQTCDFETFEREVNLIYDKTTRIINGWKVIDIFDHYLSRFGDRHTLREKDGEWKVCTEYETIVASGNLNDCFEYIRQHRYYN